MGALGVTDDIPGRICLVTSNFPRWPGDSTTPFVLHLAQDLQQLGWEIEVLAPHAPGARAEEVLDGVAVHRFRYMWPDSQETVCYQGGALANLRRNPSNWFKLPALVFCEWLALRRLLRASRFDLIHSHWIVPQGFVGALLAGRLKIPHVVTVHGGDVFGLQGRLISVFKRYALRNATAVTVNSTATRQAVMNIDADLEQVHHIPMGVARVAKPAEGETRRLRNLYGRGEGPLLIFVGRLVPEKGAGDLIAAMSSIREALPDATALLVGEGPERPVLEAAVGDLDLGDTVTFAGWVQSDRIADYLAAADIFVGPSKQAPDGWIEAQGLSFIEALMSGTPVVATRSGGIVDAVRHEETGLLVAESAPQEIAAAVLRLYHDPELAGRLAAAGQALAMEGFSRKTSAKAFSQVFASIS